MRVSSRKILLIVLGIGLLAFLVYRSSGLLHLGGFSGAKLWQAIQGANPAYLLLSVALIYGCYALRALRWQVFQKNLGGASFWNVYKLTLAGFSAMFLLGRAGEPVRPLLLARKEKLPVADMFGIYVLERLFDAASTAVVAGLGLILFQSRAHSEGTAASLQAAAKTTGSLLFAGVLCAVVFLVYLRLHGTAMLERRLQRTAASTGFRAGLARTILGFVRGVQTIRTRGQLAAAVFYSVAHWFLVLMIYYWVSHSFGGTLGGLTIGDAMLVMAFTLVGSAVQVPGVGGGSQAGSIIAYTAIFGVEREPAVAAAMVLWLISFAAVSLAGVPLLIHEGMSLGDLRRMAKDEEKKNIPAPASLSVRQGESSE